MLRDMWDRIPPACPYIDLATLATVGGIIDPVTGSQAVAIVSPCYRRGNILEQQNATTRQKVEWVGQLLPSDCGVLVLTASVSGLSQLTQICEAVEKLHAHGVVHGNIHPVSAPLYSLP